MTESHSKRRPVLGFCMVDAFCRDPDPSVRFTIRHDANLADQ
jgi:hypothetical protein